MKKDLLAKCIASYMVANGSDDTESGNYIFYFDTLAEIFNITTKKLESLSKLIVAELEAFQQIADVVVDAECFDLMFYLGFCGLDVNDFNDVE